MRLSLLLLLLLPTLSLAAIYKSIDKQGNVTFSDQPVGKDVQRVDLSPATSYNQQPHSAPSQQLKENNSTAEPKPQDTKQVQYTNLKITSPENNSSVWFGGANTLNVSVDIEPGLQAGDSAVLVYDGQDKGNVQGPASSLSFTLEGYTPGKHSILVSIRRNNKAIKTSSLVTFYVLVHRNNANK